MTTYCAIAETLEDIRHIRAWEKKHHASVHVIALSLEVLAEDPTTEHIWKLLPMDDILFESYETTQRLGALWCESGTEEHRIYRESLRFHLVEECWFHAHVSFSVASALIPLFHTHQWTLLVPQGDSYFIGPYAPNFATAGKRNALFKSACISLFTKELIPIRHLHIKTTWIHLSAKISLMIQGISKVLFDGIDILHARWFRRPTLQEQLALVRSSQKNQILFSGWGKDFSRFFRYDVFRKCVVDASVHITNLIWRAQKTPQTHEDVPTGNVQEILLREDIRQHVTYGLRISLFPLSIFWKRFLFLKKTIPSLKKSIQALAHDYPFLQNPIVQVNSIQICLFGMHSIFLGGWTLEQTRRKSPTLTTYVGSESGGAEERFELLWAKQEGLKTFSTPHGFSVFVEQPYWYLANHLLTQTSANAQHLQSLGRPRSEISPVGSFLPQQKSHTLNEQKIRIVIGTRSRKGLWSNFSSKQDLYHETVSTLIDTLLRDERFEIIIKSHPNGDLSAYYDTLVAQKKNIRLSHVSKVWKPDFFVNQTDVLVCLGEAPGLLLGALYARIPVVFLEGTMTRVLQNMRYDYQQVARVVTNGTEAVNAILEITKDQTSYEESLLPQNTMLERYALGTHPEKQLIESLIRYV